MTAPVNDGASAPPAPALRPDVDRDVGYHQEGFAPGLHRGLPSRHLTSIGSLADPVDIAGSGYKSLDEGQQVEFEVAPGRKGDEAQNVRVI